MYSLLNERLLNAELYAQHIHPFPPINSIFYIVKAVIENLTNTMQINCIII